MNFDEIFKIMDESFPNNEMRTYEGQKNLLNNDKYHVSVENNNNGALVGFLAYWILKNCVFFEHLAVSKNFRGKGIGTKIIKNNLKNLKDIKKFIFLEVEPPDSEISKKRINFYKRLGFNLNKFYYEQPPLRKTEKAQHLLIMSYPTLIDEKTFVDYKREIYDNIYGVKI